MLGFGGSVGGLGGGGLGGWSDFGGANLGVWDLDYSAPSGGSTSGGGIFGDVGDWIGGSAGQTVENAGNAALGGLVARGVEELYETTGITGNSANSGSSDDSGGSGGSGGSDSMQIPSWAAPVGVLVAVLLGIEIVT